MTHYLVMLPKGTFRLYNKRLINPTKHKSPNDPGISNIRATHFRLCLTQRAHWCQCLPETVLPSAARATQSPSLVRRRITARSDGTWAHHLLGDKAEGVGLELQSAGTESGPPVAFSQTIEEPSTQRSELGPVQATTENPISGAISLWEVGRNQSSSNGGSGFAGRVQAPEHHRGWVRVAGCAWLDARGGLRVSHGRLWVAVASY